MEERVKELIRAKKLEIKQLENQIRKLQEEIKELEFILGDK